MKCGVGFVCLFVCGKLKVKCLFVFLFVLFLVVDEYKILFIRFVKVCGVYYFCLFYEE